MVKKIIKWTFGLLVLFIGLIIIYFIAAFGFSRVTVNSEFKECEKDAVEIYVLSNGVHTDLVVPYRNHLMDWSGFVKVTETGDPQFDATNVAFGWGDKGFYIETKTWADLKFSTAFKALFYLSSSAMHVTFYRELTEGERCKKICIDTVSYLKLVRYIRDKFTLNQSGSPQHIAGASYSEHDAFYEANGKYNLFYTCNTWTNNGLKAAGLKASFWTPFERELINKYAN